MVTRKSAKRSTHRRSAADPRYPDIWRIRVRDVTRILDELDHIVAAIAGLGDRIDPDRIALAGHSWGGQTAGMLLGARVLGADGQPGPDMTDPRVKAGVLLATTGIAGDDLTPFVAANFPFMRPDFTGSTTPTFVVAGEHDRSHLSTRGPDWFTDVYTHSPGARNLLTVFGGEHSLGGIHGYNAADTTDESPERVSSIREATAPISAAHSEPTTRNGNKHRPPSRRPPTRSDASTAKRKPLGSHRSKPIRPAGIRYAEPPLEKPAPPGSYAQ